MLQRFIQGFMIGFMIIALINLLDTNRLAYLILLMFSPAIFLAIFYKDWK